MIFDGSFTATHFGVGLYARGDVLLFRNVGLYGALALNGTVYAQHGGDTSQVDVGGGLLIAF